MCTPVVARITATSPDEALQFLEKLGDKVKANPEALVMSKILTGKIHILNNDLLKTKVSWAFLESTKGQLSIRRHNGLEP